MKFFKPWQNISNERSATYDLEEGEKFLDQEETASMLSYSQLSYQEVRSLSFRTIVSIVLLTIANLVILGASVSANSRRIANFSDTKSAIEKSSSYSPILQDIEASLHDVQFNGSLFPPDNPSFSRLEPGPEADALWATYLPGEYIFPITRADVLSLGKDPEKVARFPDAYWGLGSDAYVASLDTTHKFHCLNELRKMTFSTYGDAHPSPQRHGRLWWIHLRHCVDMLMQDQLCHADADIITYNWVDTQPYPFPDFSLNRKCRDVDEVLRWRDAHSVDIGKYRAWSKPREARTLPFEKGYYEMYGFEASELFPNGTGYDEVGTPAW